MGTLREGEAVKELLKMGRDSAAQLNALLQYDGPCPAQELATKVLRSLDVVLSVVMATPSSRSDSGEVSQIPAVDSRGSGKRVAVTERRGGYKRRASESQIQVSTTMEDGYAWRKYGQKVILNAKYPRCYYRCSHKPDQGCLATKQVQIIEEEGPQKFQITYFGRHTCINDTNNPSNFTIDSNYEDSYMASFESKSSSTLSEQKYKSTSIEKLTPSNKEDVTEEAPSDPNVDMGLLFCPDDLIAYNEGVLPELCSWGGSPSSYGDLGMESLMECSDFEKAFMLMT